MPTPSTFARRRPHGRALLTLLGFAACHRHELRPEAGVAAPAPDAIDEELRFAEQQVRKAENRLPVDAHPRFTAVDHAGGPWATAARTDWRAGFFTGLEWLMFERFGDRSDWRALAEARTRDFADEVSRPQTHDIGFKTLATYGNAFRLTNLEEFRPKILAGANTLAARFLSQHGVTQSWGKDVGVGDLRVIIDNMMNLELFFLAAELTTDVTERDRWLEMAVSHAATTAKNQVRASADANVDGSTCHVYFYNLGVCRAHQGLADDSTWARGQAWAMHGFTTSYEHARRYPAYAAQAALFLTTAQRASDLYLRRLAEPKHGDWVPLHDFDAPAGNPKDSSAAAVAASALLELSALPAIPTAKRVQYRAAAERTLADLRTGGGARPYREHAAASDPRETILLRATTTYRGPGHTANVDVERGLVYGDYYYVEALLRLEDLYGPAPQAPGFLAGSADAGAISLSWRRTRGAARYTVLRGTGGDLPLAAVATTTEAEYVDGSVVPGALYRYQVTATNQAGSVSGGSNEAQIAVPGAPP